jgi:hypothetical protein
MLSRYEQRHLAETEDEMRADARLTRLAGLLNPPQSVVAHLKRLVVRLRHGVRPRRLRRMRR